MSVSRYAQITPRLRKQAPNVMVRRAAITQYNEASHSDISGSRDLLSRARMQQVLVECNLDDGISSLTQIHDTFEIDNGRGTFIVYVPSARPPAIVTNTYSS